MQSLQMRWPVAAAMGLSTTIMASAPSGTPSAFRLCISEIFSSRGQPASVTWKGLFLKLPSRSFSPRLQESFPW